MLRHVPFLCSLCPGALFRELDLQTAWTASPGGHLWLVGSNAGTGGLGPKPRVSPASLVKWGPLPHWGVRGWSQRPEEAWLLPCMVVVTAQARVGPDSEGWSHSPEGMQLLLGMTVAATLSRGGIRA